jgi:hypothetical protein
MIVPFLFLVPVSSYSQDSDASSNFQLGQIRFELENGASIEAEKGSLLVPENRNDICLMGTLTI